MTPPNCWYVRWQPHHHLLLGKENNLVWNFINFVFQRREKGSLITSKLCTFQAACVKESLSCFPAVKRIQLHETITCIIYTYMLVCLYNNHIIVPAYVHVYLEYLDKCIYSETLIKWPPLRKWHVAVYRVGRRGSSEVSIRHGIETLLYLL